MQRVEQAGPERRRADAAEYRHHDQQQREDRGEAVPGQRDDHQVGVVVAELLLHRVGHADPADAGAESRRPRPLPSAADPSGSLEAPHAIPGRRRHAGHDQLVNGALRKSDCHCSLLPGDQGVFRRGTRSAHTSQADRRRYPSQRFTGCLPWTCYERGAPGSPRRTSGAGREEPGPRPGNPVEGSADRRRARGPRSGRGPVGARSAKARGQIAGTAQQARERTASAAQGAPDDVAERHPVGRRAERRRSGLSLFDGGDPAPVRNLGCGDRPCPVQLHDDGRAHREAEGDMAPCHRNPELGFQQTQRLVRPCHMPRAHVQAPLPS